MRESDGDRTFRVTGEAYDAFMGRYSEPLATLFADAAHVESGQAALDVGCGPGALTGILVDRLGTDSVSACDPSEMFVRHCERRHPGVRVREAAAESIPFEASSFDRVLAQLVLHFVGDPQSAASEFARVTRPGGIVAACVWDFEHGMEMLRAFWDAALAVDPDAPDEARTLRFGRAGEIADLFATAGFEHIEESTLRVSSSYRDFTELWNGLLAGVGPAGAYCVSLPEPQRERVRDAMFAELGSPTGSFTLDAVARCAVARPPT